jgi:hypothetical protein
MRLSDALKRVENNKLDVAYIPFDSVGAGCVSRSTLKAAIEQGIPENPTPLERLGMTLLNRFAYGDESKLEAPETLVLMGEAEQVINNIGVLIEEEKYDEARQSIAEGQRLLGDEVPEFGSFIAEIDLIAFLAGEEQEQRKKGLEDGQG